MGAGHLLIHTKGWLACSVISHIGHIGYRYRGDSPALKDTSFEENAVLAFKAFDSYISADPDHLPFITAAGVLLLEADHITQLYLHNHFQLR